MLLFELKQMFSIGSTCWLIEHAVIGSLYQYGCTDSSCRLSSHCDRLRITTKGLNIFLHPSQGCQLIQETPVSPRVFISSALDKETFTHFIHQYSMANNLKMSY